MSTTALIAIVLLAILGIGVVVYLATSRGSSTSTAAGQTGSSNAADIITGVGSGLTGATAAIARGVE